MGLSLPAATNNDLARQKTLERLLALSPHAFEKDMPLLLRANGYSSVKRLAFGQVADLACKDPNGKLVYVWCKRYLPGHLVRQEVVLHALGAVTSAGQGPVQAMIVTTSGFTPRAIALAAGHSDQIQLIDGQQLAEMWQRLE